MGKYQTKSPIVDWGREDIEIEIRRDAGRILTKAGSRAQVGIRGFIRNKISGEVKIEEFHCGIAIPRSISKSSRVETYSYAGGSNRCFVALAHLDLLRRR